MDLLAPPSLTPTGASSGEGAGFDPWRIYSALIKRLWLVAAVFVVSVTGATVWSYRAQPYYRAEASLVIDLNPPQVLKGVPEVVDLGNGSFWSTKEYFETQYRILKSRAIAEEVVARLGLDHDADFLHLDPTLDPAARAQALKNADPARAVIGMINVVPVKDSRVVVIAIEDTNPQRAADIANAVVQVYADQNVERKILATETAGTWLGQQLGAVKKNLDDSARALFQFKQEHDVLTTSLESRQNINSERLVAINDTLTKTALRRVEIEARRTNLQEILKASQSSEFKAESFKPVTDSGLITDLRREYARLQGEQAEMSERYLEGHPRRKALDDRIKKVRSDITHATQNVLDATEGEYREVLDAERRLKQLLETAKSEALAVNKLEIDYERLRREKDQNQQVYDLMMKRQKEVDVAARMHTNNIRILDPALVPRGAAHPDRRQVISLAALFGLLLGILLVVAIELLDNTVKSQDDVENQLGLPFLGILPSIPDMAGTTSDARENTAHRDLYVSSNPKSAISECARAIRTSLLFSSPDRPFRVLLIASCGPREGKSTCAVSVAITMAASGQRVLLVDGDLRRPRLHRTFAVQSGGGLSTLILGDSTPEEAIKTTGVPGLHFLPAGPVPPNPAELLQSTRCAEVLEELAGRFDRVIIDSPPVGVVTDALVLSARADGLVLVLRAGSTPKKAVLRGKRALRDVKAHIYGAVLNDVELGSRVGQYYYYYRYGYYPSERYPAAAAPLTPPPPPPAEAA